MVDRIWKIKVFSRLAIIMCFSVLMHFIQILISMHFSYGMVQPLVEPVKISNFHCPVDFFGKMALVIRIIPIYPDAFNAAHF